MPPRVTDTDVKEILDTTVDTAPFITTAHLIVNEELFPQGLSEERLTEIEKYLAAHFACLKDPRLIQEKVGDATNTYEGYQNRNRTGLSSTSYGEQVQFLDSTGRLANLLKPKAGLQALSTQVPPWGISGRR